MVFFLTQEKTHKKYLIAAIEVGCVENRKNILGLMFVVYPNMCYGKWSSAIFIMWQQSHFMIPVATHRNFRENVWKNLDTHNILSENLGGHIHDYWDLKGESYSPMYVLENNRLSDTTQKIFKQKAYSYSNALQVHLMSVNYSEDLSWEIYNPAKKRHGRAEKKKPRLLLLCPITRPYVAIKHGDAFDQVPLYNYLQ